MSIVATPQQLEIVRLAQSGAPFKVSAFAGAAKTTTLVMAAEKLGHRCLYLAYNKRMAVEAREKFPDWVEVRTTHSLAYQAMGQQIAHKLSRPAGAYRNVACTASEIGRYFRLAALPLVNGQKIPQVALGKVVRDTVNNFEFSADSVLTEKHIVFGSTTKYYMGRLIDKKRIVDSVLGPAKKLWELRRDPSSEVMATHETYLKLYQLSSPDLSFFGTIFLDEAQDSNDCILNILMRQSSQVILVGDHYQSIYQWRGSSNALEKVNTEERSLSTSFRFGTGVAEVATAILQASDKVELSGFTKLDSMIVEEASMVPYPLTKIYRTNAALIEDAVYMLASGQVVHVEVDFRDLIKTLESAVALREGRMKDVKHDMFLSCIDWADAVRESDFSAELKRIVKMVESGFHLRVLEVLNTYKHPENPNVTLITAHKSKGLEWDNVVIAGDYPAVYNEKGEYAWPEQERNLSYVAHTRAKKVLCIGSSVFEIMSSRNIDPTLCKSIEDRVKASADEAPEPEDFYEDSEREHI